MIGMNLGLWNRGQTIDPNWWVTNDGRTLDLDALNWRMWDSENGARAPNALTVSRPSGRGRRNPLGVFEMLANNLIARDHDDAGTPLGLQIEPQVSYARVNSSMTGFVAGSPGTAPDGWSIPLPAGLTRTLSLVTTSGRPKIRAHYAGAPAANFQFIAQFFPSLMVAGAPGQVWTYAARFSGQGAGLDAGTLGISMWQTDGANALLWSSNTGLTAPVAHARRGTTVTLGAGTAFLRDLAYTGVIPAGATCAFWIDIEAPQLTQTPYLPSEFLVGASTGVRYADGVSMAIADHIGAAEGGLYIECQPIDGGAVQILAQIDDGTDDERIVVRRTAGDAIEAEIVAGGVSQAVLALGAHTGGAVVDVALGWAENDVAARKSGGALQTDTSAVAMPSGLTTLRLGSGVSIANPLNGHLRKVAAFPSRAIMTDTLIGSLVA